MPAKVRFVIQKLLKKPLKRNNYLAKKIVFGIIKNIMRICPIQNYNFNFKGSAPVNVNWRESYEPQKNNSEPKQEIPEWLRKGALFTLIGLAVYNDPSTKEFLKADDIKQQEKLQQEYFEDVANRGISVSTYHLNRLGDVDKPIIKSIGMGIYNLELTLDNGKKIEFDVNTSEKNDNMLIGYFKSDNNALLKYKAVFNPQNPEEFEIFVRNKENQKFIFGRKPNGVLYQLKNGKKIILNKENVKKYQEEIKQAQGLEDFEFFSTKNDMWRKLNLILLFLLTLNELGHDMQKRDEAKEKSGK